MADKNDKSKEMDTTDTINDVSHDTEKADVGSYVADKSYSSIIEETVTPWALSPDTGTETPRTLPDFNLEVLDNDDEDDMDNDKEVCDIDDNAEEDDKLLLELASLESTSVILGLNDTFDDEDKKDDDNNLPASLDAASLESTNLILGLKDKLNGEDEDGDYDNLPASLELASLQSTHVILDLKNNDDSDNDVDDKNSVEDNLLVELTNIKDKDKKDEENEKLKTEKALETETQDSKDVPNTKEQNDIEKKEETKEETKGKTEETNPKRVDFTGLQSHSRTHTKSTLPHILTEYGLEDKDHPVIKQQEKLKKKKKRRPHSSKDDTDPDDRQRRKARDEKFRQNFGDNRQADQYYVEYIDFLEKKVADGRLKAQKQKEDEAKWAAKQGDEESLSEENKNRSELKKVKEAEEEKVEHHKRHHLPRKLERVELKHDDTLLRSLPKTDIARIIALQDKMKKEGKLKNQTEVDKFWNDIRKPDVFYSQFKVKKTQETREPEMGPENKERLHVLDMAPRSLSHISERSASERDTWAITQKFQSSNGQNTPSGEKTRKDSATLAREAALDLERRCPKLVMPPLACFSLKLGEKPPDPEEIQRKIELKAREKSRKKSQRKLQRMYQMAMTHSAAANRILSNHGDLTSVLEGATLRDVRDFCCKPKELAVFDEPDQYTLEDYYRDLAVERHPDVDRGSEASHSQPISRQSSAGSLRLEPISYTYCW